MRKNLLFLRKISPAFLAFFIFIQCFLILSAKAEILKKIEVRNNKNVDSEVILNMAALKEGKKISADDINDSIKRLFAAGLFSDVRIYKSGETLVVDVSEYKIVNSIVFKGNKQIKNKELSEILQTKPLSSFSPATLDNDVQAIIESYKRIGRNTPSVSPQIIPIGQGRVNVVFHIKEGKRTKIAAIKFHGNKIFNDARLSQVILTKSSNVFSFFFRNDIYDKDRLQVDEEALRKFYTDRGYADFQVLSSQGVFNPKNNSYTIHFSVDEGVKYSFGNISIESLIPNINIKDLKHLILTHKGQKYSARKINDSVMALNEYVASRGYAFSDVNSRIDRNAHTGTASISYTIDHGSRAYIERIEIRGNKNTRDNIIRREFDITEGDVFSPFLIRRSVRRLQALDYFDKVDITTEPGSSSDRIILVVDVKEKLTGELSAGLGYSVNGEASYPTVQGSFGERNFLGKGQIAKVFASGNYNTREYGASFTEPYFLGYRVSAGADVSLQTSNSKYYDTQTVSGSVRLGFPITESFLTQVSYNISQEQYEYTEDCKNNPKDCPLSQVIADAIAIGEWVKSSIRTDFIYSSLDNGANPGSGIYAKFSSDFAGLGGDARYIKLTTQTAYYKTLQDEFNIVGSLSVGGGYLISSEEDSIRFFDQFQSTTKIIRGFENNGIGPYDSATELKNHIGGSKYMNASLEVKFPVPFIPENFGVSSAIFMDAATLYDSKIKIKNLQLSGNDSFWRASAGVSLIWASPFGPLRMDYAIPLRQEESDKVQEFSFGVSAQF